MMEEHNGIVKQEKEAMPFDAEELVRKMMGWKAGCKK